MAVSGKVNYHPNDKNQLEGMYFISEGNNTAVDSPRPSNIRQLAERAACAIHSCVGRLGLHAEFHLG